jgi:hypothetical protein
MSSCDSRADSPSAAQNECPDNTIASRRKRLAEMIGRLLARTWLNQRQVSETKNPPHGGPKKHGRSR